MLRRVGQPVVGSFSSSKDDSFCSSRVPDCFFTGPLSIKLSCGTVAPSWGKNGCLI